MRGDGDVAMGKGDDTENMKTLGKVIEGQREIIKDIYGREDAVPQLWAIFTEVQRYYDAGFTVPDDVTLLLCPGTIVGSTQQQCLNCVNS